MVSRSVRGVYNCFFCEMDAHMQKNSAVPALPTGPILQAVLPVPPSVNRMYRNVPRVGRVSTRELLLFKEESLYRLNLAPVRDVKMIEFLHACYAKRQHLPLHLEIIFYYKTLWRVDVDSGIKAVQDVLFQFLSLNDNLVVDISVKKRADAKSPHCKIRLSFAQMGGNEEW